MKIVLDIAQNIEDARLQLLLKSLETDETNLSILSADDVLDDVQDRQILFITPLETDWLGYHNQFVEVHGNQTASWIVVITGNNPAAAEHMKWAFQGRRTSLNIFNFADQDPSALAEKIREIEPPVPNSILLYSVNPSCGKQTLKELLNNYLSPDWTVEIAEEDVENPTLDVLAKSHASVKVIVSDKFNMLHYGKLKTSGSLFFVLTKPDRNVALYLQTRQEDRWAKKDLEMLADMTGTTLEAVEKHLFFISPLYETWRIAGINPSSDVRFVMWDDFGLPILRDAYSDVSVRNFLSQFNQGEALAAAIASV